MQMNGERSIPAPRQTVWEALNDPDVLKACIPGCEELEKTGDHSFAAKVKAKVGPVSAKFNGEVTLSDINAPESYTISGEGKGGAAGFAKGGAKVKLTEDGPESTLLSYDVDAKVGGKLAQVGSRLIDGTAKKMADQFFNAFAERVGGSSGGGGGSGSGDEDSSGGEDEDPAERKGGGEVPPPTREEEEEMREAALRGAALGHSAPESDGGASIKAGAAKAASEAVEGMKNRPRSYGLVSWVFMVIAVVVILLFVFGAV